MSIEAAIMAEKKLSELRSWYALGSTFAAYDCQNHKLRVDINVGLATFCGQQYAGASNYHDAPKWFNELVVSELEKKVAECVKAAYEQEVARLAGIIEDNIAETNRLLASAKEIA